MSDYVNPTASTGMGLYGIYSGANRGGVGGAGSALSSGAGLLSTAAKSYGGDYSGALSQAGNTAGGAGNALGIYGGVEQGGVGGYGSAALNSGKLAGRSGLLGSSTSDLNQGINGLGGALNVYQGVKQGGVSGYGQAVGGGLQSAGAVLGNSALSTIGGYVAAPLALYNAGKNWKSGATGSDAMQGASAGAAIGSIIPGVGTAIGALAGAAIGAGSSAFGPGKEDPENLGWNAYAKQFDADPSALSTVQSPTADYQNLAGIFDSRGSQIPIYDKYGRMGENSFLGDMGTQINDAIKSGTINAQSGNQEIYDKVIDPWVTSMAGDKGWQDTNTVEGSAEKGATQNLLKNLAGEYVSGQSGDWTGIDGQKVSVAPRASFAPTTQADIQSSISAANPTYAAYVAAHPDRFTPTTGAAEGGLMKKRKKLPARFDDGGDVDWDSYDPNALRNSDAGSGSQYAAPAYSYDDSSMLSGFQQPDTTDPYGLSDQYYVNAQNDPLAYQANTPGAGGSSGGTDWAKLLKTIAPAIPLVASALTSKPKGNAAPTTPAGFSAGASTMPVPQFNRQAVAQPTNSASGQPMTQQDWYTYGTRPEASFFSNNSIPLAAATTGKAKGGALDSVDDGSGDMASDPGQSMHVRGPGDGTSDDIPAKLSDGEYVFDAGTVSMLGNGSNDAGARALDKLRQNLRKHAGRSLTKGKQFMKAHTPEKYLAGGEK